VTKYRCIAADLRTGTRIAELPLRSLSFSQTLNDVGEAAGTLPLPAPTTAANRATAATLNDAVDEARRQLIIEREGVVVWCGVIWMAPYDDDNQTRTIRAAEDWSYFRRRRIDYDAAWTATDQLTIAKALVDNAQASPGGNINITTVAATSGVSRDFRFGRYELKPVAEAFEDLAKMENGFDFAIEPEWSGSSLVKTLRLSYPRRGRSFQQSGHVFEVGRNVLSFTWPTDGTRVSNKVWATGNGEGDAMLIASATDAAQIQPLSAGGPGYPLLEDSVSVKDETQQANLNARATARLQYTATPVVLPTLTVRADMDPVLGAYITGDACRIIIPPNVSPRFPDGLDTFRRIVGFAVEVDDEGTEAVTLTLGEEPSA
jgi:hypothetical protein